MVSAVKNLTKQWKRILVVDIELERWPSEAVDYVRENTYYFLLRQESVDDDVFTLYAALHSGPNALLLTNDRMRDHSHLLSSEQKTIFVRWLQMKQKMFSIVESSSEAVLSSPTEHKLSCHKCNAHWHIPYLDDDAHKKRKHYKDPKFVKWACIKLATIE